MFFVSYNSTGAVVSYSEGSDISTHDQPKDCETLTFATVIPGFTTPSGSCTMKVDLEKKELVFINPKTIPKPLG